MAYWLLRTEPETFGWDDMVRDKTTEWDGVRNPTARLFLKEMQVGDQALFYHSGKQRAAVGIIEVNRTWRPDGEDGKWASVGMKIVRPLARPVTLADMKAEPSLKELEVLRLSRLSVTRVREDEWRQLLKMAER